MKKPILSTLRALCAEPAIRMNKDPRETVHKARRVVGRSLSVANLDAFTLRQDRVL